VITFERKTPSGADLKNARDELAYLIDSEAPERSFQGLFSRCPYIISETLPVRISPIDIVPMGAPGRSEPDFIFYPRSKDSIGEFGVIEIKRPDSIIATMTRKNIETLSRDAETAISQCQHFLHNLDFNAFEKTKSSLMLGLKGHIFVIMGLSGQLYKTVLDDLLGKQLERRVPANCRLLPYDNVLENFSKQIEAKVYLFVPAFEKSHSVVIMDGGIRFGNGIIGRILSELIRHLLGSGSSITIDEHMEPFTDRFRSGQCAIPVVILNPEIEEMPDYWPLICSGAAYESTPFLFINNPLKDDIDGAKRLKPYIRQGFDSRTGMPFRLPEIAETIGYLTKKTSEARAKLSLTGNAVHKKKEVAEDAF
jgi:hypothetical protein